MSRQHARLIDKKEAAIPRPKEMQVLGFGLSRTGTMSLQAALNKLNYRCYHMSEVQHNRHKGHFWCWYEAMVAKFKGRGPLYGPADFDKLLEDYSAVTDIPCVLFSDELLTAFPDAKVILTNRDVDRWIGSVEKIYAIMNWRSMRLLALLDSNIAKYLEMLEMALGSWTSGNWQSRSELRDGFLRHYQHIRSSVPPDRLLEFRSEDGWAPLCKFLDKPTPAEPYPRVNVGNDLFRMHYVVMAATTVSLILRWMLWLAPVGAVALYYLWNKQ